jgi:hypothetical protein
MSYLTAFLINTFKSGVAIETLENDQSHYMIFVFIGELTNWPNKMFPETGPYLTYFLDRYW